MEAEREIAAYYAALFMKDKVGERFDGVVSAVVEFGLFVELERLVRGGAREDRGPRRRVRARHRAARARRPHDGRAFRVGEEVEVEVASASPLRRRIELKLVEERRRRRGGAARGRSGPRGGGGRGEAGAQRARGRGRGREPSRRPRSGGPGQREARRSDRAVTDTAGGPRAAARCASAARGAEARDPGRGAGVPRSPRRPREGRPRAAARPGEGARRKGGRGRRAKGGPRGGRGTRRRGAEARRRSDRRRRVRGRRDEPARLLDRAAPRRLEARPKRNSPAPRGRTRPRGRPRRERPQPTPPSPARRGRRAVAQRGGEPAPPARWMISPRSVVACMGPRAGSPGRAVPAIAPGAAGVGWAVTRSVTLADGPPRVRLRRRRRRRQRGRGRRHPPHLPGAARGGGPPVGANATSTVALCPASSPRCWPTGGTSRRSGSARSCSACPRCSAGRSASILLLALPESAFAAVVPWLILFACALLALQRPIRIVRRRTRHAEIHPVGTG